jgi:hypothetical protein
MKEVKTEIEIDSSSATAWRVLTDFSSFGDWNPVIVKITGEARSGERLEISLRTSRGRVRTYRPVITKFEENHELRWKGSSSIPGFLNGERIFTFYRTTEDHIRLLHLEIFSGLGAFLAGSQLEKDVKPGLQQMNVAFKKRVEQETKAGNTSRSKAKTTGK